jgi:hypothetical protein
VVLDHAHHIGVDAALIARVQRLERPVVTASDRGDKAAVFVDPDRLCNDWPHCGVSLLRATHGPPSSRVRQREDRKL